MEILAKKQASQGDTLETSNLNRQTSLDTQLQQQAESLAALLASGQILQGETELRPLLQAYPDWGLGWKLQAAFLTILGRHEKAFQAVRTAAQFLPNDAELFNIIGTLFRNTGELDKAINCFLKSAELNPAQPEVHNNLGGAFMLKGELDYAIQAFGNAVQLNANYPEAQQNLGSALLASNRHTDAIRAFLRAAELNPAMQAASSMACLAMLQSASWEQLETAVHQLQANLTTPGFQAPTPFVFNALPGSSRQQHLRCAQQFAAEQFGAFLNQPPRCKHPISKSGRLRIGYLSADFHGHATAYLLAGVLEQHDRSKVEIIGYSYGPTIQDSMRQRLQHACDVFRDIHMHSHEQAAQLIAMDQLDILVDLKGFTDNARPQITALRPAPVIVNWLGYPSTLGQRRLADYIIGDPVVTPPSHQADFSETLALLPDCYQPTDSVRTSTTTPTRKAAGLPEEGLVFCSFNQIYKITPSVFDVWCRILAATPDSVLWLLEGPQIAIDNLRSEAQMRGIDAERLIFAPKLPQSEHLARLALADLALDTSPYTSHTTGSDALWAGVPLLTTIGSTFGSRVAASLLVATGLPELVCNDWHAYLELAVALAKDTTRRQQLRQHLLTGRQTLPLFDTRRFTRNLEALFETIRQQQITGFVRSFAVAEQIQQ